VSMLYIWAVDYKISPQITLNTNLVANIQVIFFGGKFHRRGDFSKEKMRSRDNGEAAG